jgi:hypothetical protein
LGCVPFFFQASGASVPGNHSATSVVEVIILSTIPGLSNLLDFGVAAFWQNGSESLQVGFSSNAVSQSIFTSDFIAGPNGTYSLDPNKRHLFHSFYHPRQRLLSI